MLNAVLLAILVIIIIPLEILQPLVVISWFEDQLEARDRNREARPILCIHHPLSDVPRGLRQCQVTLPTVEFVFSTHNSASG